MPETLLQKVCNRIFTDYKSLPTKHGAPHCRHCREPLSPNTQLVDMDKNCLALDALFIKQDTNEKSKLHIWHGALGYGFEGDNAFCDSYCALDFAKEKSTRDI